jgi:DNA mismatch repair protein MutS
MDLLQGKAFTAHKYNYCKPVLAAADKSFFRFTGIRHPLIEHLQTNELYVTNDLALGTTEANAVEANVNGILLYGTNAVGKTSFIKSVGIAIIMAQAGLYVPCNAFTFQPYRNLFTRILGNDNIFKGLSTFAVEMTELRTILNMADAHSLVLGDELCSGTESDSALSIFTAGLEILHTRESTFLFATHFHELNKYAEIISLNKMKMLHMAVHYNQETQTLVYDRKLREGSGESMYGLEVCKSLNLPDAFLQRAHDIRMKYHPETKNVLALSPSHYNAKKLVGNCELCQKHKATEVHHLQHQKRASSQNEYITDALSGQSFHKNHTANLLNICEVCHKKIHKTDEQHKVVKTSKGYKISKI